MMHSPLASGFMVIHGNKPELLKQLLVDWFKAHPLAPLENETILVQSNGIAQWLKLAMAGATGTHTDAGCGIAAAFDMSLPSNFMWKVYRAVLGPEAVPDVLPFDKPLLIWRLMRLLPSLVSQPGYEPLAAFLQDDLELRKRYQLSEKIADLYDQYQVYRADWLDAWSRENDVVTDLRGQSRALDPSQRWQALLWRALLADAGETRHTSRAAVHRQFLHVMATLTERPARLPRRVSVFGLSSLPGQSLDVLRALSRFTQVLLCVNNPCQHHWADILTAQDMARRISGRHSRKPGMPDQLAEEDLHLHAQPLLASWGKQGRDYIHFIDETDRPAAYQALFEAMGHRIDLFESHLKPDTPSLLNQLQEDILDLRSASESRSHWPAVDIKRDHSLRFHSVHSIQREVEVLQDQLLAAFNADATLRPRDVIVMVPDVNLYAPHIEAVFGQLPASDPRHIPFSIADRAQRQQVPMVFALEFLLRAPESRMTVSEVLDLLDVRAVRQSFGIDTEQLPLLQRWIRQSHIRWGLDARQRQPFMEHASEQNTWLHGLRRMLLGYAVGGDPTHRTELDWHGIEPLADVAGLDAELVGPLSRLLQALATCVETLSTPTAPAAWRARLQTLLSDFFATEDAQDAALMLTLQESLQQWEQACAAAQLVEDLPLNVVREHWLEQLNQSHLTQRFMAGRLTFATLMPMRAIPFRRVCLLGMSDGEFPRNRPPLDFDLMARDLRPGDRSRREDDRYLFLEALLSARDHLHISWVGKRVQDNSVRPASVLVNQLRDHIDAVWHLPDQDSQGSLVGALTVEHRLQAFSPAYFGNTPDTSALFTYAREWECQRADHNALTHEAPPLPLPALTQPIALHQLAEFLKNPVKSFLRDRLHIDLDLTEISRQDEEPFALDALEQWALQRELIEARLDAWHRGEDEHLAITRQLDRLERQGDLPLGTMSGLTRQALVKPLDDMFGLYRDARQACPEPLDDEPFSHTLDIRGQQVSIEGLLMQRFGTATQWQRIELSTSNLMKDRHYRHDQLLHAWVHHLAAHVSGHIVTTHVIGKNGKATLQPLDPAWARQQFTTLVEHYVQGLCRPLPLAAKTGFAWLSGKQAAPVGGPLSSCTLPAVDNARKHYEDGYQIKGEATQNAYLQRVYPTFESLWSHGEFTRLCEALYAPLKASVGKSSTPFDTQASA